MSVSRDAVLHAARRLFGERGYQAVTIREVAAAAGVSPAMVMKLVGSKEQLYAEATPLEPTPLEPDAPRSEIGRQLVRRLLTRREESTAEPWLRAVFLMHESPDPDAARQDFRQRFLGRLDDGTPDARRRAELVACMLIGLAAGARSFRLLDPANTDREAVVEEYGGLLQALIDGTGDRAEPGAGDAATGGPRPAH